MSSQWPLIKFWANVLSVAAVKQFAENICDFFQLNKVFMATLHL